MSTLRDEFLERMKQDIIRSCDKRPVYLIEGPPGAGKTTYVQEHKGSNDLVVDLDLLVSALQGNSISHPDYSPVMDAVMAAREAIYNTIEERQGKWSAAYIITSNPNKNTVNKLAGRLNAKVICMSTNEEICIERIMNDESRTDKQRDADLVREWYKNRNHNK